MRRFLRQTVQIETGVDRQLAALEARQRAAALSAIVDRAADEGIDGRADAGCGAVSLMLADMRCSGLTPRIAARQIERSSSLSCFAIVDQHDVQPTRPMRAKLDLLLDVGG